MILPIVAYGTPVLRKKCENIDKDYPDLQELIVNMFETMYKASGVGLAAPQIGKGIRIFIIDSERMLEDEDVFINAKIVEEEGEEWKYTEGCLSIPKITEDVSRKPNIKIEFYDENWEFHTKEFSDLNARVIQHEYDHIEGVLFTDYLKPLKKKLIQKKLTKISKGDIRVDYKMKFPK
ncbi:UNVERIFIED_CONTAM: hypothetical protein GTU68_023219 [Idotea baltica]|nr:hypothetical protein [Idotea baltica]